MQISAPIYHLKRRAKQMSKAQEMPLHQALDLIAGEEGYMGWSHLAASHNGQSPAQRILAALNPGQMLLLGARPGQGKTLLALELALEASKRGEIPRFYTLDYTQADVDARLTDLGAGHPAPFAIETSDEICASYIEATATEHAATLVVIDYMQLLDQKRINPPLEAQLAALRAFATHSGVRIVLISQIDRRFDLDDRVMPGLKDVRLPNPADLHLFDKTCFLHERAVDLVVL